MIHHGDCLKVMAGMSADSVDAIVTDPPYGLDFMGREWDHGVPGIPFWREALRVAKPGAHIVAFGGTRTYHRLTCALEDAGWEIRDSLMWLYGTGFPKSLDVSKAIDKAAGAERGTAYRPNNRNAVFGKGMGGGEWNAPSDPPVTDAAKQWEGWGTALKPAWEPIILARKPLVGTVAANVLAHGTGAINVDACRIATTDKLGGGATKAETVCDTNHEGWDRPWKHDDAAREAHAARVRANVEKAEALGRWPANVVLDEEAARQLDEHTDDLQKKGKGDSGGASRFYYCAKASSSERHAAGDNTHPTVKPVKLMAWLCRLITPPSGVILDPFCGSGSTGVAALEEGFQFIGIEREAEYAAIARRRTGEPEPLPPAAQPEAIPEPPPPPVEVASEAPLVEPLAPATPPEPKTRTACACDTMGS